MRLSSNVLSQGPCEDTGECLHRRGHQGEGI
jgi:hypothetical protein